jgi:lipoprotein-releasing system ATP-binding protein
MLCASGLTKIYQTGAKELRVLKNVDVTIARGEALGIVGPSGAGKSTLLHILGGLDDPTEGSVYLDDFNLSALDDKRRAWIRNTRFGFVFQFYHLMREFSALENVLMPALIAQGKGDRGVLRRKAAALLDFLGLSERLWHRPTELSGGEQQRVAIARSLMNDPEILFCDEPTGNLDHESGKQIRDLLFGLNKQKKTTLVLVTHSQELAKGSHRILNIFDGKITDGK